MRFIFLFSPVLPAAALDGIFFSPSRQNYLNYGTIGTIIGHELAHGFGLLANLAMQKVSHKNDSVEIFFETAKCLIEDCNNIGVKNTINVSNNKLKKSVITQKIRKKGKRNFGKI